MDYNHGIVDADAYLDEFDKLKHHYKIYYRYDIMEDDKKFIDIEEDMSHHRCRCDLYEYGYCILKQKHPKAYISKIFVDGEEFIYTEEDIDTFIHYLALREYMNSRENRYLHREEEN